MNQPSVCCSFFHEGKMEFLIKNEARKAECGLFAGLAMGPLGCPKESDSVALLLHSCRAHRGISCRILKGEKKGRDTAE